MPLCEIEIVAVGASTYIRIDDAFIMSLLRESCAL